MVATFDNFDMKRSNKLVLYTTKRFIVRGFEYSILNYHIRITVVDYTVLIGTPVELVSKELNHLAAILHVYAGDLNFMK